MFWFRTVHCSPDARFFNTSCTLQMYSKKSASCLRACGFSLFTVLFDILYSVAELTYHAYAKTCSPIHFALYGIYHYICIADVCVQRLSKRCILLALTNNNTFRQLHFYRHGQSVVHFTAVHPDKYKFTTILFIKRVSYTC